MASPRRSTTALMIVVEQHARDATELRERLDMTAHEEGHHSTGKDDAPRVAQYHHESPERPERAIDLQLSKVCPVHLGLLAGQRAKSLKCFRWLLRAASGPPRAECDRVLPSIHAL
jgi:hypothetical protein